MARDHALDLGAVPIDAFEETPLHLPAIPSPGPDPETAHVDRDDGEPNSELFATEPVIRLGVKAHIREHAVETDEPGGLAHDGPKLRRIVARTGSDRDPGDQVRLRVTNESELGIPAAEIVTTPGAPADIVDADVVRLEARGINRGLGAVPDQAARGCTVEYSSKQPLESASVCKKRFSALHRVE
jgi:hypothetical protein